MINIGEEKGAWLRIVADLENELALVRKIENEKDSKISSLQDEIKTLKENAKKFKRENSSERDGGGSRGGSRSGTPHRGGEEGVSRSQEIEAWMDLCNSLSLSKPVFSASGAVHSTTLKSVVDAVKGFRIKQVEKEKIIDQQNSTIKELEEKLTALKDSRAASPSNNSRKNAHFADESLPLGFSEEEYYAATGRSRSTSQAGGRKGSSVTLSPQSQQALHIAETLSNVMMEGFSRHVLNSLNEKIDFVCSSTSQAIGEPRWRGPKHADGARWIGTWDNVVAQDQQQQQQQQQQMQGAAAVPPSAQQGSGFPQANQYYTSEQQQSLQAPPRSSSAYNNNNNNSNIMMMQQQQQQRGSSPTNWRRVLDSHLGSSYQAQQQQQQQQQQNSHLYQQQQNRQIVTSTSSGYGSNQNSPFRGHNSNSNQMMAMNGYGSSSPTGHHNYVHPHANRPPPTVATKRPSPPRSTSPLGASQTIRQILERMQAERSSFARSRSGSPQHNNNNQADFMYSGHHSHQYPFVNRAIRRSQSPPDHRGGGGDHQFHQQQMLYNEQQQQQQQRLLPPNNTRFVALPPPMSRMKPGGRSLTPSGLRSSSALSTQNIYGRYR